MKIKVFVKIIEKYLNYLEKEFKKEAEYFRKLDNCPDKAQQVHFTNTYLLYKRSLGRLELVQLLITKLSKLEIKYERK